MIFEKFHQSKAVSSTAPIKSTGLGLAIAKVLTEGHNGTIGVESEVGKGTRFFVRIPTFRDNYSSMEVQEDS
jgi:two-component system phosphate regulon sensor histidine kinase PhoR